MATSKGKGLTKRAGQAQREIRIEQAVNAYLEGKRTEAIVAGFMEQYGLSQASAYVYTKAATDRIKKKMDRRLEDEIEWHYQRLERLYTRSMDAKDIRTARIVLKDIADLLGLDAPKRREYSGPNGTPLTTGTTVIAVEDLDTGIELYQKMKAMRERVEARRRNVQEGEIVENNTTEDVKPENNEEDSTE